MIAKHILVALTVAVASAQVEPPKVTYAGIATKVDRCFAPQLFQGTTRIYSENFVLAPEFKVRFKYHAVPEEFIERGTLFHVRATGGTRLGVETEVGGRLRWQIVKFYGVQRTGYTPAETKLADGIFDIEIHVNGASAVNHYVDLYVDGELLSSESYYYPIPLDMNDGADIAVHQQYNTAKGVVCNLEVENIVTFAPPPLATRSCSYCENSPWSTGPVCQMDPVAKNWGLCQFACQEGVLEEQLFCGGGFCYNDNCIVPNSTL